MKNNIYEIKKSKWQIYLRKKKVNDKNIYEIKKK